jgi:O-antigen/teichoic acid export membrane protein
VVPMVIGAIFLADGIIELIGGEGFSESANVLRILIFALAFIFFGNFFNNILIAANHQKKMLAILACCAIFNVSANFIFVPLYSYTASATISAITEFFVASAGLVLTAKYVSYVPRVPNIGWIIFSGLIMAIFMFFFRSIGFFQLFILGTVIYALFLWLTKTITINELRSIVSSK